jgi:hypothetical protein
MENYTKEQLIAAQTIYNQQVVDNPELFDFEDNSAVDEKAEKQINYLLSLVK